MPRHLLALAEGIMREFAMDVLLAGRVRGAGGATGKSVWEVIDNKKKEKEKCQKMQIAAEQAAARRRAVKAALIIHRINRACRRP